MQHEAASYDDNDDDDDDSRPCCSCCTRLMLYSCGGREMTGDVYISKSFRADDLTMQFPFTAHIGCIFGETVDASAIS